MYQLIVVRWRHEALAILDNITSCKWIDAWLHITSNQCHIVDKTLGNLTQYILWADIHNIIF